MHFYIQFPELEYLDISIMCIWSQVITDKQEQQ